MIWHGEREIYPPHTSLWYKCAECNQRCQFRLRLLTINSWWIFTSFLFLSGRSLLCHVMFTHVLCFNSVENFFSFALSNLSLSKFYVLKWISDRGRHNNLLWRKQLHWMLRESEVDWCICSLLTSDLQVPLDHQSSVIAWLLLATIFSSSQLSLESSETSYQSQVSSENKNEKKYSPKF